MALYFSLGTDATKQLGGSGFDARYLQCPHLELWAVSAEKEPVPCRSYYKVKTEFITLQQFKKAEDNV